jgi:hypothetical protein
MEERETHAFHHAVLGEGSDVSAVWRESALLGQSGP